MATENLTAQRLRELLDYNPETGVFIWRQKPSKNLPAGMRAGSKGGRKGYEQISVLGTKHYSHRLAWFYVTGEWPKHNIDHKNGNGSDNRFCNLRDVPQRINRENQLVSNRNNVSGMLGVRKIGNRFYAAIRSRGVKRSLGGYATAQEAHAVYLEAKRAEHDCFLLV